MPVEVDAAPEPAKVSFENGGAFVREVRGEVETYLSSRAHTDARPAPAVREDGSGAAAARGVVGGAHVRASGPGTRSPVPARRRRRSHPRRLLRSARRESRCVLPFAPPEPPARLVERLAARVQQLRVACQAQRRASHVHERGRLRRRHRPDAVRADAAVAARETVVSAAARVRLAALHAHADAAADRRRRRRACARSHRQ